MAVMKKSVKGFSKDTVSKDVASRKKRKGGVLKDTGDTTESDSVDIEREFLIEETSVDYGKRDVFVRMDSNQMPKGPRLVTKQALGKPLDKINFLGNNDDNNILLDEPVDKLAVVRKLFSKINGFGGVSTPSKFSGIIWIMFTSKSSLMKATKLATNVKILVNTNLKKSTGCSNWAVVLKKIPVETSAKTVRAVLSEFGMIKLIKMQLYWFCGWKTCVIDHHLVIYAWARCAIVCFELAKSLDVIIKTTPVLKDAHLHWFYLGSVMCAKCEKLGHTSLSCVSNGKSFSSGLPHQVLSDTDKDRLAAIYTKHSAPVACSVSFGRVSWAKIVGGSSFPPPSVHNGLVNAGSSSEIKPTLLVMSDLKIRFAVLESSIASFVEQIGKLAKRLDLFMPAVFQPSSGCQLSVTPSLQD
ncbi:hypothetical protein G9A89_014649 [Geosiphon pyriformis]|nr:hypothetical protein G9A89_014649 [Geosiphon pyriformis]